MQPRGYFATFFMLAATTGLPFAVLWSCFVGSLMGRSFGEVFVHEGLATGLAVGGLGGAILAFRFRAITMTLPVGADPDAFLSRVTLRLAGLGYHPEAPVGHAYTFRPSFYVGRAAGRITVVVEPTSCDAIILGPVMHLSALRKLLLKDQSSLPRPYRG